MERKLIPSSKKITLKMKTILYATIFLVGGFLCSQEYSPRHNDHEIRFNMGRFLVSTTIEGAYEYYFTPDTSIGGTFFFNGDAFGRNGNFGVGPNLRAYFGFRPKSGMFAEAFALYYTGQNNIDNNLGIRDYDYDTTAIGLGLGRKWSTFGDKLTFELVAGLGRNINPEDFQNSFMYKAGLSLGFRF